MVESGRLSHSADDRTEPAPVADPGGRTSVTDTTSLLLVSDDPIVRAGLSAAAVATGRTESIALDLSGVAALAADMPPYDYALVHMWPRAKGLDRLPAVDTISLISQAIPTVTVMAMAAFKPSRLVVLRLAEAGCRFVFPYAHVRNDPPSFFEALRGGEPDRRFALATQWAIREELGLRWDGQVAPFLEVARSLPPAVWTTTRPQSSFGIERARFRAVQVAARDVAGLPEPPFGRYANSLRRPPELPEWQRLREFVRTLWALPTT